LRNREQLQHEGPRARSNSYICYYC